MLRGNLATRPFYNERLVTLLIALVGVIGLALAAYNVTRIAGLSSQRSALRGRIVHDTGEAARIDTETQALQKSINIDQLNGLASSTGEANGLIDQRTFSWTAFFTVISKTLPLDARLISVAPKLDKDNVSVQLQVVARTMDDLSTLVKALTETGAFYDVLPTATSANPDNTITATISAGYLAPKTTPAAGGSKGKRP
jgi:hypothetical protein